jgi:rRNA maturation endonuclease Nob1
MDILGFWIFNLGIKNNRGTDVPCSGCGIVGVPTSCLPFLGAKRFCAKCGSWIMKRT